MALTFNLMIMNLIIQNAAILFTVLITVTVLFQFALALGAPLGHLAMGGRYPGKFPAKMRFSALFQAVVLCLLSLIVLARSQLILADYYAMSEYAIWVVCAITVMSSLGNLLTPSKWERIIWAPVAILLLICTLIVALA